MVGASHDLNRSALPKGEPKKNNDKACIPSWQMEISFTKNCDFFFLVGIVAWGGEDPKYIHQRIQVSKMEVPSSL